MLKGSDYLLRLKTEKVEGIIPFLSETLREKIFFSEEYAPIEGEGWRAGICEAAGTEGGFTTALTLDSTPAIFGALFGKKIRVWYIDETRNMFMHTFKLCAADESLHFFLHEQRGSIEKVYPECFCKAFEIRIEREGTVKVHLDIDGNEKAETRAIEITKKEITYSERFNERGIEYFINDEKYNSIYRFRLSCDKSNGCRTTVIISRYLNINYELPDFIESMTIRGNLFRDIYEEGQHGKFAITLSELRLISDDTEVCAADTVIGARRYSVGGIVTGDCFSVKPPYAAVESAGE